MRVVRGDVVLDKTITVALPALQVEATATPRCVAGKVQVATVVKNLSDKPIQLDVSSAYGTKSIAAVQPGKSATVTFATRSASVAAGTISVAAAASDGRTADVEAVLAASACD
ncbi:hypothetical protein D3C87_1869570 [compost metagenome]